MPHHTRRFGPIALVATIVLAVGGVAVVPAAADPIGDAQAQAKSIQDQIDTNNRKIGALGEQYDGAQLKLQQAEQSIADAQSRIATTQHRLDEIRVLVNQRAVSIYHQAAAGQSLDALDLKNAEQLLVHQKYAASQAARDNSLLQQLKAAKQQLAVQETDAEHARAAADTQRQQLASAKQSLEALNAQQQQTLSQVQGQLAQLVLQEQQRRQAAALASALARFAPGTANNGNPQDFPNLPPPGPAAAAAIAFARSQLGRPYVYAAAGPDAYDCSGLVMAAYASAGVQLPHYSGAQYAMLPHVALSAALPGDLLYWGDAGSEHVAIYLGAGRIIEEGGTSNDVHIGPIWGQPIGAARPA